MGSQRGPISQANRLLSLRCLFTLLFHKFAIFGKKIIKRKWYLLAPSPPLNHSIHWSERAKGYIKSDSVMFSSVLRVQLILSLLIIISRWYWTSPEPYSYVKTKKYLSKLTLHCLFTSPATFNQTGKRSDPSPSTEHWPVDSWEKRSERPCKKDKKHSLHSKLTGQKTKNKKKVMITLSMPAALDLLLLVRAGIST